MREPASHPSSAYSYKTFEAEMRGDDCAELKIVEKQIDVFPRLFVQLCLITKQFV